MKRSFTIMETVIAVFLASLFFAAVFKFYGNGIKTIEKLSAKKEAFLHAAAIAPYVSKKENRTYRTLYDIFSKTHNIESFREKEFLKNIKYKISVTDRTAEVSPGGFQIKFKQIAIRNTKTGKIATFFDPDSM